MKRRLKSSAGSCEKRENHEIGSWDKMHSSIVERSMFLGMEGRRIISLFIIRLNSVMNWILDIPENSEFVP